MPSDFEMFLYLLKPFLNFFLKIGAEDSKEPFLSGLMNQIVLLRIIIHMHL